MKQSLLFSIAAVVLFMVPVSCQKNNTSDNLINDVRLYFENTATALLLPNCNSNERTKSNLSEEFNTYPNWEDAIVSRCNGSSIVEAPLSGTLKLVGEIAEIRDGKINYHKADTKSYLMIIYGKAVEPEFFVETFIERGNSCSMTAVSNKDNVSGFKIISDLNGNIKGYLGYNNGTSLKVNRRTSNLSSIAKKDREFIGFRLMYATTNVQTKSSLCSGEVMYICNHCYVTFFCNHDEPPVCPVCGERLQSWYGTEFCPDCGKPWSDCACPGSSNSCAPCGRNTNNCSPSCKYDKSTNSGICNCE